MRRFNDPRLIQQRLTGTSLVGSFPKFAAASVVYDSDNYMIWIYQSAFCFIAQWSKFAHGGSFIHPKDHRQVNPYREALPRPSTGSRLSSCRFREWVMTLNWRSEKLTPECCELNPVGLELLDAVVSLVRLIDLPAYFSRDYRKMFGAPPQRDIAKLRALSPPSWLLRSL